MDHVWEAGEVALLKERDEKRSTIKGKELGRRSMLRLTGQFPGKRRVLSTGIGAGQSVFTDGLADSCDGGRADSQLNQVPGSADAINNGLMRSLGQIFAIDLISWETGKHFPYKTLIQCVVVVVLKSIQLETHGKDEISRLETGSVGDASGLDAV